MVNFVKSMGYFIEIAGGSDATTDKTLFIRGADDDGNPVIAVPV